MADFHGRHLPHRFESGHDTAGFHPEWQQTTQVLIDFEGVVSAGVVDFPAWAGAHGPGLSPVPLP